jgi:hypothetical protein
VANTQAMCTSFKTELLTGTHNFGTGPVRPTAVADTFKAALYLTTATLGAGTTAYTTSGEVTGTNYTAGGTTISGWATPAASGTTAFTTPSASFSWPNVTLSTSFDTVLVYNSSQGSKSVSVHVFGAQTVTAGTFTLTMPTNAAGTALLQIA